MKVKAILCAIGLATLAPAHATILDHLTDGKFSINQCTVTATDNTLDLAILGEGYFIVSQGDNDSESLFTRYGNFYLNNKMQIVNSDGQYLLKLPSKEHDPKHLSKIQIPTNDMPPKATNNISVNVNLSSTASTGASSVVSTIIYDSLGRTHEAQMTLTKSHMNNTWYVGVSIDANYVGGGTLGFNPEGTLSSRTEFDHIEWITDSSNHKLHINFEGSTQYGMPFFIRHAMHNGYSNGHLVHLNISHHGEIFLNYDNGQSKALKGRIAIARFRNPTYLEKVMGYSYRPTKNSGQPLVHWTHSEHVIHSHTLEDQDCYN